MTVAVYAVLRTTGELRNGYNKGSLNSTLSSNNLKNASFKQAFSIASFNLSLRSISPAFPHDYFTTPVRSQVKN